MFRFGAELANGAPRTHWHQWCTMLVCTDGELAPGGGGSEPNRPHKAERASSARSGGESHHSAARPPRHDPNDLRGGFTTWDEVGYADQDGGCAARRSEASQDHTHRSGDEADCKAAPKCESNKDRKAKRTENRRGIGKWRRPESKADQKAGFSNLRGSRTQRQRRRSRRKTIAHQMCAFCQFGSSQPRGNVRPEPEAKLLALSQRR